MKNICILISTLLSGGAEKQSVLLCKALHTNYKTHLVVFDGNRIDSKLIDYAISYNLNIVRLYGHFINKLYLFYGFLRVNKIDIVFSYLPRENIIAAVLGKISKIKYIIGGIRTYTLPYKKFIISKIIHNSSLTKYVIFNNYSSKDNFIKNGYKKEKCLVIHNGIEINQDLIIRQPHNILTIVSICRFIPDKDLDTALIAISHLKNQCQESEIQFIYNIVGYGILEPNVRQLIYKLNLGHFVNIIINPVDVINYYKNSDIYLSTSIREGMSNSILEAMNYSLPIVATDAGDNKHLVTHEVNGYCCTIRDHLKISEYLNELLLNRDKRIKMGTESYNIVKKEFSFEAFRTRYIKLINHLDSL